MLGPEKMAQCLRENTAELSSQHPQSGGSRLPHLRALLGTYIVGTPHKTYAYTKINKSFKK